MDDIPNIPNDNLKDCLVLSNKFEVFKKMPKNGNVGELGVHFGETSEWIYKHCNPKNLHLFESNYTLYDDLQRKFPQENIYLERGYSFKNLEKFDDNYFDWIFIDSEHDYDTTNKELEISHKKIKDGGFILLHDYFSYTDPVTGTYGVISATNEFIWKYNYRVRYLSLEQHGFHTIGLSYD